LWRSVLVRRSQRAQMRWDRLTPLLSRWIPQPRILHPYVFRIVVRITSLSSAIKYFAHFYPPLDAKEN
jgi:hypothetical protein